MGHAVGVFSNAEIKALSRKDRAALKKEALKHLRTSRAIHNIISANPKHLTEHPEVRDVLRSKMRRTYNRLKKK